MKIKRPGILRKIQAVFRMLYIAWNNPVILTQQCFKNMSDLFETIMQVAEQKTHLRQQIVMHVQYEDHTETVEVVSLWIGSGAGADPHRRIGELVEENALLRSQMYGKVKETT